MKKLLLSALFAAGTLALPALLAETAGEGRWSGWSQENRFLIRTLPEWYNGSPVLEFNSMEEAGLARLPVAVPPGRRVRAIRFSACKSANAPKTNQEVMLEEKSGEAFYRNITLGNDWKSYEIPVGSMSLYPYGNAKVENGRLDHGRIVSLRFNCFPQGGVLRLAELRLEFEDDPEAAERYVRKVPLPGDPAAWFRWSAGGGLTCGAAAAGDALVVDGRAEGGYVSLPVKAPARKVLESVAFRIRALPGAGAAQVEAMLVEKSGEIFFRTLKLTPEFQAVTLDASNLHFYPYGNAPKENGVLEMDKVRHLRFNCYPTGQHFELAGLEFQFVRSVAPEVAAGPDYEVRPIRLSRSFPDRSAEFPLRRDIRIDGANFTRDGRPYFMLGGWQLDQEGPPWYLRTFDADVMIYNADEIYTLYGASRDADGKLSVEWLDNPWYPAVIERFLHNGINFWHEHKGHPEFSSLKRYPELRGVLDAGHFLPYDPWNPDGVKFYGEMFKSWMRYTREYPVFCYELFNEMIYNNPHRISRDAFKEAMKRRYRGDIAAANRVWRTEFPDFAAVEPPGYLTDGGRNESLPRELLRHREGLAHPNLYVDWQKFQEERSYGAIRDLMPKMRANDPRPAVFSTVQSHLQFLTDYGDIGIRPEALVDFSDFYSHECGSVLIECGSRRNDAHLFTMLKTMLAADLVGGINPDKPSFDAEAPVYLKTLGATEEELTASDLAGLTGQWSFCDATVAEPEHWQAPGFDDRGWKPIRVPAMWGKEGFAQCRVGLYRKRFRRPAGAEKLYLNGRGFADNAELWLNGEKLGVADGYDAKFTFDLTGKLREENVLAVKIRNEFFSGGMYYGGIRGFVSVNADVQVPPEERAITGRHLRTAFWNMAAHGLSGLMFSYEGNFFTPAAKALPRIKAEINSVAPLLYDRDGRPPAPLALVYPQETFRGVIHADYLERMKGPATAELLKWYAPLQFSRRGLRVIRNIDLATEKLDGVRLVALPGNRRIPRAAFEQLKRFVEAGGIAVADFNALTVDDNTHLENDIRSWVGAEAIAYSRAAVGVDDPRFGRAALEPRFLDGLTRAEVTPAAGAETIARFTDGNPLLLKHPLGKGVVYTVAGALPGAMMRRVLDFVLEDAGVPAAPVELSPLDGRPVPYAVDARLFGAGGDRQLLYLSNWDPSGAASVRLPFQPDGEFRIRIPATGRNFPAPSGREFWSGAELRSGIPVKLDKFDPAVLLIERRGTSELALRGISPTRLAILNELWKAVPEQPGRPVVAVSAVFGGTVRENTGTIPTAWKLLADNGFNVRNLPASTADFTGIDVVVWPQQRLKAEHPEKLVEFVKNGGSLLLCGNARLCYHTEGSNDDLLKVFGLAQGELRRSVLYAKPPRPGDDVLRVHCADFNRSHPVAANAGEFVAAGSTFLDRAPEGAEVILRAPADSSAPGKPLIVSLRHGKGRVLWIADHWFLRPFNLERGDNLQLWYDAVRFLAGLPPRRLTEAEKERALFLTEARLARAEEEEKNGICTFAPLEDAPTTLNVNGAADLIGLSGGDPIVDQFK